jgi:glutamate/tyrosine decarboxylase-like PLP-dependent enzyme
MRTAKESSIDVLDRAASHARSYLAGLETGFVGSRADLTKLRDRMNKPLPTEGLAPDTVIDELVLDASHGLIGSAAGRFFGWVIGGTLPVAIAADWLTSVWDQNATICACSPAAAIAEEVAGSWLKEILGLPAASSFSFVTGCQMAHVTCLAAARSALLHRVGLDVVDLGLAGAPPIRVLANERRHASIERAVSLIGLGRSSIEPVATNRIGQVDTDALRQALVQAPGAPTIVVLQAGDIATGAFDNFEELIPIARSAGAWVHIDGAFGLWAAASSRFRHLRSGVDLADSWVTDGHKMLNTPFDSGYAFIADRDAHRAAFSLRASYLTHADDARDEIDWTPEWSRRARGFVTYAALRTLGRRGVGETFDRCCEHTRALVAGLAAISGVELVSGPVINQALIRFPDERPQATEENHDRNTDRVIEAINATGEAFFSGTTWCERRVMRISVCNWRTSTRDVERAIDAVRRVLLTNAPGNARSSAP